MTTPNTPTGISLKELAAGFKNQNIEIPSNIKELMDKERKPRKPRSSNTANTIVTETSIPSNNNSNLVQTGQEKLNETKSRKAMYTLLKNLMGKNIANRLMKRNESIQEGDEKFQLSDIKTIKRDVKDIKEFLKKKGRKIDSISKKKEENKEKPREAGQFVKGFVGSSILPKLGYLHRNTLERIEYDKMNLKQKFTKGFIEGSILPKLGIGNNYIGKKGKKISHAKKDQDNVLKTEQNVIEEHENKNIHEKLNEILHELKKNKGSGGIGGILPILAGLASRIKGFFGKFKGIFSIFKLLKNGIPKILTIVKDVGKFLKEKGGGIVRKTVNTAKKLGSKLKNALEDAGIGAPELIAGVGAAAATGAEVWGINKMAEFSYKNAMKHGWPMLKKEYGLEPDPQKFGSFILKGKKVSREDLPDSYKTLIDAYALPYGGAQQKALAKVKSNPKKYQSLRIDRTNIVQNKKISTPKKLGDATKTMVESSSIEPPAETLPPIVINGGNTTVNAPNKESGTAPAILMARNPDQTIHRLNSSIFDDPAGWNSYTKL